MNQEPTYRVIRYYCLIFYVLMLFKWQNGMFLYQLEPSFFYLRDDIFTWLFMQTRLHQWLLFNPAGCVAFDVLFYSAPMIFFQVIRHKPSWTVPAAAYMLITNWIYIQCYTLYPTNSIEGHLAWLIFPFIFLFRDKKSFLLLFDGLRYFFLFFFCSSGIWKIVLGGIFNPAQMSGVLLFQHNTMLASSPLYWQSRWVIFLVQHQTIGYLLYCSAAALQLLFIIGFFTKRFDRWLAAGFIVFLLADYLIMRISYVEVMPLLLTLTVSFKGKGIMLKIKSPELRGGEGGNEFLKNTPLQKLLQGLQGLLQGLQKLFQELQKFLQELQRLLQGLQKFLQELQRLLQGLQKFLQELQRLLQGLQKFLQELQRLLQGLQKLFQEL